MSFEIVFDDQTNENTEPCLEIHEQEDGTNM